MSHYECRDGTSMTQAELDFAVRFAQAGAGEYMVARRKEAIVSRKLDKTAVTDVDKFINDRFIAAVKSHFGESTSVVGEEASARTRGSTVWVIDPIDGTGEYIDTHLADSERTSCVGIALFKNDGLQLSVVYNPFRKELFAASRELGGAFLNNKQLNLKDAQAGWWEFTSGIPYDYCHWDDCLVDARFFEKVLGTPLNSYSAINQACDVARGRSAFAIFPGNTIHDIAPSALQVELAGGVVSDVSGMPLNWRNLNGAIYAANPRIHAGVIRHLNNR